MELVSSLMRDAAIEGPALVKMVVQGTVEKELYLSKTEGLSFSILSERPEELGLQGKIIVQILPDGLEVEDIELYQNFTKEKMMFLFVGCTRGLIY